MVNFGKFQILEEIFEVLNLLYLNQEFTVIKLGAVWKQKVYFNYISLMKLHG